MGTVRSDVLVVGAGPAGLTAAAHLAREQLEVTVIEERTEPAAAPVVLTPPGLEIVEELGIGVADLQAGSDRPMAGLTVRGLDRCDLDDVQLLAVDRRRLVRRLEEAAVSSGATILRGVTAVVPVWELRRVGGIRAREGDGAEQRFEAAAVVDATGSQAFLPAALGQLMPRRGRRRCRIAAEVEGVPVQRCELIGNGLDWVQLLPVGRGELLAVVRDRSPEPHDEADFDALLASLLSEGRRVKNARILATSVGIAHRSIVGEGWIAVGEAAGCGGPAFPGSTSAGLVIAASAAWEVGLALHNRRGVSGGHAGASIALTRKRVRMETLLDRALGRAAKVGILGEAASTPGRRRLLTSMLEGRWADAGGWTRTLLFLWWLDRRSRRRLARQGRAV